MIVALQLLSKVLDSKDISILLDNNITAEYFAEYSEEANFIFEHYQEYGVVPDKETFLAEFDDIELVTVTEPDKYLVSKIQEEYLFTLTVPVLQRAADYLDTDSRQGVEYLLSEITLLTQHHTSNELTDITSTAKVAERLDDFKSKLEDKSKWFFTTGFPEFDELLGGIQRFEELLIIVARTNQGKSWVLEKICAHIWSLGYNVGFISPEMSSTSVGYRLDTLTSHYSNTSLMRGDSELNISAYEEHLSELEKSDARFLVGTPKDFDGAITVTKLKQLVKKYELQLLAVDGIKYLTDERAKRGDSITTQLSHIAEDLMELSVSLNIPVIAVVQANRSGVADNTDTESTPDLESIRDSDGIAMSASKVISIRQTQNEILKMQIKKNRNGRVGASVVYNWDIDTGQFTFIKSSDADVGVPTRQNARQRQRNKGESSQVEDVF